MNMTWNVTFEMDQEYGTDYRRRLKHWIIGAQGKALVVAEGPTDAKGDRNLRPSQQPNRDSNFHINGK